MFSTVNTFLVLVNHNINGRMTSSKPVGTSTNSNGRVTSPSSIAVVVPLQMNHLCPFETLITEGFHSPRQATKISRQDPRAHIVIDLPETPVSAFVIPETELAMTSVEPPTRIAIDPEPAPLLSSQDAPSPACAIVPEPATLSTSHLCIISSPSLRRC
jgi:hypothetical protein